MGIIYNHTQSVASLTWTITHNLGCEPVSDVQVNHNGSLEKILPLSVKHIDENTLLVEFSQPRSGSARLVGTNVAVTAAPAGPAEYRFFRINILGYAGQAVRFQAVRFFVGGASGTGYPLANELPMTSNTTPAPLVASASSYYTGGGFEPYLAFVQEFGGNDTWRWIAGLAAQQNTEWLQLDLGIGNEIHPTHLKLCPDSAYVTDYPTSFSVTASNTGAFAGEEVFALDSGTLAQADWNSGLTLKTFPFLTGTWA